MFKIKRIFLTLLATSMMSATSFADTWKETDDKGLFVYTAGNGSTGQLTLVCDPDNLWSLEEKKESSQFYLFATLHNERLAGKSITLKVDDFSGSFAYAAGALVADGEWNKLIEALSKSQSVAVSVDDKHFSLALDKPLVSKCITSKGTQ